MLRHGLGELRRLGRQAGFARMRVRHVQFRFSRRVSVRATDDGVRARLSRTWRGAGNATLEGED